MLGHKYFMDPRECCAAVLMHWFNNPSDDYPTTWGGLCELLEDCELGDVVSRFKDFLLNYIHIPTKGKKLQGIACSLLVLLPCSLLGLK